MSFCCMAMRAANSAVIAPIHAIVTSATSVKMGNTRHNMYTPAATIVAAWMRAETGVGPSMASGSQTCSGNCALLPMAPQKMRRPARVEISTLLMYAIFTELVCCQIKRIEPEQYQIHLSSVPKQNYELA